MIRLERVRLHCCSLLPLLLTKQAEIIETRGYPLEIHQVVTQDGYVLELKRIPGSRKCAQAAGASKKPVFLQHGMMGGDHVYVINTNENALGISLLCAHCATQQHWLELERARLPHWRFRSDSVRACRCIDLSANCLLSIPLR